MTRSRYIRKRRVTDRLNLLQHLLESNTHTTQPEQKRKIQLILDELSLWFSAMDEDDREYLQCAQDAIDNDIEWIIEQRET